MSKFLSWKCSIADRRRKTQRTKKKIKSNDFNELISLSVSTELLYGPWALCFHRFESIWVVTLCAIVCSYVCIIHCPVSCKYSKHPFVCFINTGEWQFVQWVAFVQIVVPYAHYVFCLKTWCNRMDLLILWFSCAPFHLHRVYWFVYSNTHLFVSKQLYVFILFHFWVLSSACCSCLSLFCAIWSLLEGNCVVSI